MPDAEKDAPRRMRHSCQSGDQCLGCVQDSAVDASRAYERGVSAGTRAAPADGHVFTIAGEAVTLRYVDSLATRGEADGSTIRLREWDERVFLHEVLHILLGRHYPPGRHGWDRWEPDPEHEPAVRTLENGLWDMGWRAFDGHTVVTPDGGDRSPLPDYIAPEVWVHEDGTWCRTFKAAALANDAGEPWTCEHDQEVHAEVAHPSRIAELTRVTSPGGGRA